MGESGFKGLVIGFILLGLFMFAVLSFSITIANDYGKTADDITGGSINFDNVETYLGTVSSKSNESEEAFTKTGLINVGASDTMTAIWDVTIGLGVLISTPFNYLAQILLITLKIPYVIVSVILGILGLIVLFGIWRVIRIGE